MSGRASRRRKRAVAIGIVGTGFCAGAIAGAPAQAEEAGVAADAALTEAPAEATPTPDPTPSPTPEPTAEPDPEPTPEPTPSPTPEPAPPPTPDPTPEPQRQPAPASGETDPAPTTRSAPAVGRLDRAPSTARGQVLKPEALAQRLNRGSGAGCVVCGGGDRGTPRERRERRERHGRRAGDILVPGGSMIGGDLAGFWIRRAVPTEVALRELRMPPFLLPIYHAAAARYGIPWEVLAAINQVETDFGRNRGRSSAGATGWMQFMPSTWAMYGVDANRDGSSDPDNPVDAIFAAARYLQAAGAQQDLRAAIFAYNHAGWYVDRVLAEADRIAALPPDLVDALTVLASGTFLVPGGQVAPDGGANGRIVVAAPGSRLRAGTAGRIVRAGKRWVKIRDAAGNYYGYTSIALRARLNRGTTVSRGAALGRIGRDGALRLAIRPATPGTPSIDPAPILAGWKLLDASGFAPPRGTGSRVAAGGMTGGALARRVLANPRIRIYDCGREDIAAGRIDRRVLATLELLARDGLAPTVTSLQCGHSLMTKSGNISEHATGTAVDIAAINGVPVMGNQGEDTLAAQVVRRVTALPGELRPHQVISLMRVEGASNAYVMGDHADHIHLGWAPGPGSSIGASPMRPLTPADWSALMDRLGTMDPPTVRATRASAR